MMAWHQMRIDILLGLNIEDKMDKFCDQVTKAMKYDIHL